MQLWRYVLAGSVCAGLAFLPSGFNSQRAEVASVDTSHLKLNRLKLEKVMSEGNQLPARSPLSAFTSSNRPLQGITICVDPGHGGQAYSKTHYTGGTVGVATGQTESDVNLRVALILRQYLEAAGARVVMTRLADTRCQGDTCKEAELDFRSNVANAANADLFISVHHNQADRSSPNYTAVFHPAGVSNSTTLAANISSAVSKYLGTQNVGAKIGDYRVLNKVRMPGVIVEASFMSNPSEDQRLASLSYNKMEAKAIATGILNYYRLTKDKKVDFKTIFAPLDDQAGSAQMMADASFVRRQIVEQRSLFGVKYEEVTYDPSGKVASRRAVGNSSIKAKTTAKAKAEPAKKVTVSKSKAKPAAKKVVITPKKTTNKSKPVVSSSKSASEKSTKSVAASKSTSKKSS